MSHRIVPKRVELKITKECECEMYREMRQAVAGFLLKCRARRKVATFAKNVQLDRRTAFEGENYIGHNSVVCNTKMGFATYIGDNSNLSNTRIGRFSCISHNVAVVEGKHPIHSFVSVHPAFYNPEQSFSFAKEKLFQEYDYLDANQRIAVNIGNDVWIGYGVLIMPGVTIHDGAVVAAGAVVTKNVAPYTIVAGVPAKPIGKRFTDDEIDFLLNLKWWDKEISWIREHADFFSNIEVLKNEITASSDQ